MDVTDAPRDLFACFDTLPDPRVKRTRLHRLDDIVAIAILGVVCGCEGWTDIADFGRDKLGWLKTFLALPHGVPSHDTFGRVFAALDPDAFERCFLAWTQALAKASGGRLIAADGKAIRRSFDAADQKAAIHLVSAFAADNRLVLGQVAVEDKSNEITALPRLLDLLDVKGAVVTADAMHCQTATAAKVVERGGDYVLAVKDNQPSLHEDLRLLFEEAIANGWEHMPRSFCETIEKDHGRLETRRIWCTWDIQFLRQRGQWANLASVACVECVREIGAKRSLERRYFISSLDGRDAEAMLGAIRGHWSIENQLHWCLDVSFGEDQSRLRKGHGAENFSRLRRLALNLLGRDSSVKLGLKAKAKTCGWDHDYLLKVLTMG